jgi:hypothetical protein
VLDRLVEAVRDSSESRALVVHGEAGVGKTALLEYLAGHAGGRRVARAAGVQAEMELAFAGLHQLCAPMLDRLEALPPPQRDAPRTAFGVSAGPAPDRFLIGLAVLSLLPRWLRSGRCCAWSMRSSGSTTPRRRSLRSLPVVWGRIRLGIDGVD